MVDVDVRVSSHLKEELTWAIDKRLRVINTIMLFKKAVSNLPVPVFIIPAYSTGYPVFDRFSIAL